jgi:hypothetical protein
MSTVKDVVDIAKNCSTTKKELVERLTEVNNLNTGEKAALTIKLMADKIVYEAAINIMGDAINDCEMEIESLEFKNTLLEKELSTQDKERINAVYNGKKKELQNDNNKNSRIMNRLNKTLDKAKQITNK